MNTTPCPEPQYLKQFLLGALPIQEIESCQEHLSVCDPCMETVEGLKVDDTFTNLTRQAWIGSAARHSDESGSDDAVIDSMMQQIGQWEFGRNPASASGHQRGDDRAAEVQRLLGEPVLEGGLGQLAHYRIIELLGSGSTGVVYLASDTRLDRSVVLKVLRPSLGDAARKRFTAEAKATAAIDHPNVVTIYEVGTDGPLAYIAMQWLPGQTLEQRLGVSEALDSDDVRRIATQIATGLAEAHSRGLIHRDIKPANVWIPDGPGEVKILDFGLVRITDEDPKLTCTGIIAGTPCFMSPEQSRGEPLDPRSDLFSLGCLMYQSLTGRLPFHSDNALATLRSIQQDQPTPLSEIDPSLPRDLSDLVMCLLEKSPNRRPPSAQAVVKALESDRDDWEFEVRPAVSSSDTAPRRRKRYAIWKTVAGLIAAGLIGVAGTMYGQQIIRIVTNQGEIEIETNVDDVKIEVVQEGNVVRVIDLATQQSIEIKAGQYEIRPVGNDNSISIDRNQLVLSRGAKEIVKITRNNSGPGLAVGEDPPIPYQTPTLPTPQPSNSEQADIELQRLENLYQEQQSRFERNEISRLDLLDAEADLLEQKTYVFRNISDPGPFQQFVDVRSELLELLSNQSGADDSGQSGSEFEKQQKTARENLTLARNRLTDFERSWSLPPSLPIYDGKTYEQLLAIVLSERDLSKLNPALKGIANLASDNEQVEMLDAVMQIARRGVGIASDDQSEEFGKFLTNLFRTLSLETLANLFINELAKSAHNGRNWLFDGTNPGLFFRLALQFKMGYLDANDQQSVAMVNQVFKALEKFASTDSRLHFSYQFLIELSSYENWHSAKRWENPSASSILQIYYDKYLKDLDWVDDHDLHEQSEGPLFKLIKARPQTTGLLAQVENGIQKLIEQFDQATRSSDQAFYRQLGKQLRMAFLISDAFPESMRPMALQLELANAVLNYARTIEDYASGVVSELSVHVRVDEGQLQRAFSEEKNGKLVRFELQDGQIVIKTDGQSDDDQENQ